jgi:hypothetical protein
VNDPKFSWVARKAGCNVATVIAVWAALLEHASQDDERGSFGGFDPESYDCTLGIEDGACQRVIDAMRLKGLLEADRVAMWEARQNKADANAERQRRHREKLKAQSSEEESKTDQIRLEEISLHNGSDPLRNVTPVTKKASKGTGIPDDFALTPDLSQYAIDHLPNVDVPELFAAFRDYHKANGTIAKDWQASWRTWARNAQKFGYPMVRPTAAAPGPAKVRRIDPNGRVLSG